MSKKDNITAIEYSFLKRFNEASLNANEKKKLKDYEAKQREKIATPVAKKYFENLHNKPAQIKRTYENLLNAFKLQFALNEDVSFDDNQLENINTVLYYFVKDKRFFECKNLSYKSKPSFDKGLLIVGGVGTGKSVTFDCLNSLFNNTELVFKHTTANNTVTKYESLAKPEDKDEFFRNLCTGTAYFDDLKTERDANNYGRINLFKEILEERNSNKALTFASCNYAENDATENLDKALLEFHNKYGMRVHDRLFSMFNIIEFNGKSMR